MKHPRAKTMIHFALIMVVANLLFSGFFYVTHNKDGGFMMLCGSIAWLVAVFVWLKTEADEKEDQDE